MQRELVAHQRVAQTHFEFFALFELGIEGLGVILEPSAAALFRLVHGEVGGLDQSIGRIAGLGVERDADTRRRIHFAVTDFVFFGKDQQ